MPNDNIETILKVGQIIKLGNLYGKVIKNTTNTNTKSKLKRFGFHCSKGMLVVSYFAQEQIPPTGETYYSKYSGWDFLDDNRKFYDNKSTFEKITKIWDCHPCCFGVVDFGYIPSLEELELGETDTREYFEFVWEKENTVKVTIDDEKFEVNDEKAEEILEILYADQESYGFTPNVSADTYDTTGWW